MKSLSPKQKLALEYGSNLRVIKGCCTQLRKMLTKIKPLSCNESLFQLGQIETALILENGYKYKFNKKKLDESAALTTPSA
jgi:hypothetical protein